MEDHNYFQILERWLCTTETSLNLGGSRGQNKKQGAEMRGMQSGDENQKHSSKKEIESCLMSFLTSVHFIKL